MSLQGKRVASLESRLGEQLAPLVSRQGALPLSAPALAELPDTDPNLVGAFLDACALEAVGAEVHAEPRPPKLGPLVALISERL